VRGRKTALMPVLASDEQVEVEKLVRSTTAKAGLVKRPRAVLLVSQGNTLKQVAQTVDLSVAHVSKWCRRFIAAPPGKRMEALRDKKGRGRKPLFSPSSANERHQDRL